MIGETLYPRSEGSEDDRNLDIIKKTPEELAREELIGKAYRVLLSYALDAIYPLYDKVRKGEGKQVLSPTEEGRPLEELLDIDQTGENVLKSAIRKARLPAILITENSPEPQPFGNGDSEKLYVFADPFDNTSQYKRGLDTPPYTIVSIFDNQGNPIGAVVGDIKNRKAYMCLGKETFMIDIREKITEEEEYAKKKLTLLEKESKALEKILKLKMGISDEAEDITLDQLSKPFADETDEINPDLRKAFIDYSDSKESLTKLEREFNAAQGKERKREKISRSERTTLKDPDSTLATFVGEKEYSLKFLTHFEGLIKDMHPKGLLYTGGGAYIYSFLASGIVDAYIMFDEPISEIIPGLPLAIAAGCEIVSVHEDGTFEDFKFYPNTLKEDHRLYSEGSIPLLIVAATPEIRDEIIKYYLKGRKEIANKEKLKEKMKLFNELWEQLKETKEPEEKARLIETFIGREN